MNSKLKSILFLTVTASLIIFGSLYIHSLEVSLSKSHQLVQSQREKIGQVTRQKQETENLNVQYQQSLVQLSEQKHQLELQLQEKDKQIQELKSQISQVLPSPVIMGSYKEITVEATAYTAYCNGCSGITATGFDLRRNPGAKIVAVDPRFIPLGKKVFVEGYGYATTGDTGGAIKGNKVDLFFPDTRQAIQWGRRSVKMRIYD